MSSSEKPRRTALQTKEVGVKQLIDAYRDCNRSECPQEKVQEFVKKYEQELLPKIYDKKK